MFYGRERRKIFIKSMALVRDDEKLLRRLTPSKLFVSHIVATTQNLNLSFLHVHQCRFAADRSEVEEETRTGKIYNDDYETCVFMPSRVGAKEQRRG